MPAARVTGSMPLSAIPHSASVFSPMKRCMSEMRGGRAPAEPAAAASASGGISLLREERAPEAEEGREGGRALSVCTSAQLVVLTGASVVADADEAPGGCHMASGVGSVCTKDIIDGNTKHCRPRSHCRSSVHTEEALKLASKSSRSERCPDNEPDCSGALGVEGFEDIRTWGGTFFIDVPVAPVAQIEVLPLLARKPLGLRESTVTRADNRFCSRFSRSASI